MIIVGETYKEWKKITQMTTVLGDWDYQGQGMILFCPLLSGFLPKGWITLKYGERFYYSIALIFDLHLAIGSILSWH
jgi:hypothetical protein